jgi:Zn-dependent protease
MPPAAEVGSTRTIPLEVNGDKVIDCKCTNEMTARELRELTLSALGLALAFGIVFEGGLRAIFEPGQLILAFFFALVGVSLGFVLHEMGHRSVARRFDYFAQYSMWPGVVMLAIACSFFGFVFATLGAVVIHPRIGPQQRATLTRRRLGLISIAGPTMNICLAVVFMVFNTLYPATVFSLGAWINTWFAVFNLIPLGPLDGAKIIAWDRRVWLGAIGTATGLLLMELVIR